MSSKPIIGIIHKNEMEISGLKHATIPMRLFEIHYSPTGTLDDKPAICFVLASELHMNAYAPMTFDDLNDGLADIGYRLEKI